MDWTDQFDVGEDGVLIRKRRTDRSALWNGRYAGKPAGTLRADGYLRVHTSAGRFYAHRIVYEMLIGPIPEGFDIDHINMNRADNRPENLRLASRGENKANGKLYATNSTGAKGVTFHKRIGKFQVAVGGSGRREYIGQFDNLRDAKAAYERAAKAKYGQFFREGR
jgi:hypothetical protein